MFGDYSNILVTIGSLACVAALAWFFESTRQTPESDEETVSCSEDIVQKQRASLYVAAVILIMGAAIVSVLD